MANSYIVSSSGNYFFSTKFIGNGAAPSGWTDIAISKYPSLSSRDGNYGYWVYGDDVEVTLNQNNCIRDVVYSSDRIFFKATGNKGNAKVTLKNNGARIWTWHIWCTDQPATITNIGTGSTKYTILDRNLGAYRLNNDTDKNYCNDEDCGFYYPFGSPIGFTAEEYSAGVEVSSCTMQDAFALHPERPYLKSNGTYKMFDNNNNNEVWVKIWGSGVSKTMFDPCPPGYKVMSYDVLAGYDSSNRDDVTGWYYGVYIRGNREAFFPGNGRAYRGSYTDRDGNTRSGIQNMNITLGGTNYDDCSTRRYRVFLWSSNSLNDNAYCYTIRHTSGGTWPPVGEGGMITDILTRGMGVRCMTE